MSAKDEPGEKLSPRVAFNRLRNEVAGRLEEGYTRRAIYREFERRLGMSYAMFCRYVISLERTQPVQVIHPARGGSKRTPAAEPVSPAEVPTPASAEAREPLNAERDPGPAAGNEPPGERPPLKPYRGATQETRDKLRQPAKPKE